MSARRNLLSVGLLTLASCVSSANAAPPPPVKNVVLVHGGFVDGSGWEAVFTALTKDGYHVSVVQNPTTSLADDVAATKTALAQQDGPTILVGHSYGGAVITEAGTDAKVAGLVYIAAFAPDAGESVSTLIKTLPADAPMPPIVPAEDGFLMLDQTKFAASFAADLPAEKSAFMAASQLHWGVAALEGTITVPAWKAKPSWYLMATDDMMIAPTLQKTMADRAGAKQSSTAASHSVYLSKPEPVVALIEQAAKDAAAQAK